MAGPERASNEISPAGLPSPSLWSPAPSRTFGSMAGIDALMELVGRLLDPDAELSGFREPIRRGSAQGFVSVEEDAEDRGAHLLVVRLGIMPVPETRTDALHRHLLELNHGLRGRAAFSISEGFVYLTAGRPMEDLDPGEILDLVLWTAEKADRFDDELMEAFGVKGEGA